MCMSIFSHVSFNKINYFARSLGRQKKVPLNIPSESLSERVVFTLLNTIRFNFVFFSLASSPIRGRESRQEDEALTTFVRSRGQQRKREKKLNLISPKGLELRVEIDGPDEERM